MVVHSIVVEASLCEDLDDMDLHVTPATVKSSDPVVALDCFPALGAFSRRVPFHLIIHLMFAGRILLVYLVHW